MKYNIYINYLHSRGFLDITSIKNFYEVPEQFSWRSEHRRACGTLIETRYFCKRMKEKYSKTIYEIKPVPQINQ